jgi:hypothetical protein
MKQISDPSRYDVNNVRCYLIDVSRECIVRPLGQMSLSGANQLVCQYGETTYPYSVYATNDRELTDTIRIKQFSQWIKYGA